MSRLVPLLLLMLLAWRPAVAADVKPFLKDERLGVIITRIDLPVTLPKDLVSGLTNKLLIQVAVTSQSELFQQTTAEVNIKYDLWSESFAIGLSVNNVRVSTQTCGSVQEVEAFLADIRLPGLFPRSIAPPESSVKLQVKMLLNPIERERLEAIRKWVKENSTYLPADTTGFGGGRPAQTSRSNALFNRIFEQYAQGKDFAAGWHETLSSAPFRIDELAHE